MAQATVGKPMTQNIEEVLIFFETITQKIKKVFFEIIKYSNLQMTSAVTPLSLFSDTIFSSDKITSGRIFSCGKIISRNKIHSSSKYFGK